MYRLKKGFSAFSVVDGVCAGQRYVPGKVYAEVPPQEKHRFEDLTAPMPVIEAPDTAEKIKKPETARRHKKAMFPQNKEV